MTSAPQIRARALPMRTDTLMVGILAVLATCVGRGLAPGLPGSRHGIGPWIEGAERLAAFVTQFLVILGVATAVRMLLVSISFQLRWMRPVIVGASAAALPVIISASSRALPPSWLAGLAGLSAILATAAAAAALRDKASRAAGLVLALVLVGSLISAAARLVALDASGHGHARLFGWARLISTGAVLFDAAAVVLAGVWLGRQRRSGWIGVGVVAVLSAWVAWLGSAGDNATGLRIIAVRALEALIAHPDPFIGSGPRFFLEVSAVALAVLALWQRRPAWVGEALAFALLARVSGDVPVCGLMLILAALAALLASQWSAPAPHSPPSPTPAA